MKALSMRPLWLSLSLALALCAGIAAADRFTAFLGGGLFLLSLLELDCVPSIGEWPDLLPDSGPLASEACGFNWPLTTTTPYIKNNT